MEALKKNSVPKLNIFDEILCIISSKLANIFSKSEKFPERQIKEIENNLQKIPLRSQKTKIIIDIFLTRQKIRNLVVLINKLVQDEEMKLFKTIILKEENNKKIQDFFYQIDEIIPQIQNFNNSWILNIQIKENNQANDYKDYIINFVNQLNPLIKILEEKTKKNNSLTKLSNDLERLYKNIENYNANNTILDKNYAENKKLLDTTNKEIEKLEAQLKLVKQNSIQTILNKIKELNNSSSEMKIEDIYISKLDKKYKKEFIESLINEYKEHTNNNKLIKKIESELKNAKKIKKELKTKNKQIHQIKRVQKKLISLKATQRNICYIHLQHKEKNKIFYKIIKSFDKIQSLFECKKNDQEFLNILFYTVRTIKNIKENISLKELKKIST